MRAMLVLLAFGCASIGASATATGVVPEYEPQVPVRRLEKNIRRYLAVHGSDAEAHFALARVDAMIWENPDQNVEANEGSAGELPRIWDLPLVLDSSGDDMRRKQEAIAEYRRALELDKKCAICALGLGSILEAYPGVDRNGAIVAFRQAWTLSARRPRQSSLDVVDAIADEAGEHLLRLLKDSKTPTAAEKKEIADMEVGLRKLNAEPTSFAVSPIIFGFENAESLRGLLADGVTARFDLDGLGRNSTWPWVRPTTGILVWDPKETGKVFSGRQLFGNVTFWVMFSDGYRALAGLDDNDDGALTGRELDGISVWRDQNSNGVSDPGEVISTARLGVVRISTKSNERADGVPACNDGLRFGDGRSVRTIDWTPTEVRRQRPGI